MKTLEVIAKTKAFKDDFGNDLADDTNLKSKRDCLERLQSHRRWLENASEEALRGVDNFIRDLGIEFVGVE